MPDPNAKYIGAWGEISARIQARERIMFLFVALTAVASGVSLSKEELVNCSLPIGYVALAAAFLSRHHDLVIGCLRRFQNEISKLDDGDKNIPEYTTMAFLGRSIRERSKREYAQVLFILLGMCVSVHGLSTQSASALDLKAILWYVSLMCSVLAIVVAIKTQLDRKHFPDIGSRL